MDKTVWFGLARFHMEVYGWAYPASQQSSQQASMARYTEFELNSFAAVWLGFHFESYIFLLYEMDEHYGRGLYYRKIEKKTFFFIFSDILGCSGNRF